MTELKRGTFIVAVTLLFSGTLVGVTKGVGQERPEQQLIKLFNEARTAEGLNALASDESLTAAAEKHAEWMARGGSLSHQYSGEADLAARAAQSGAHFQTIAENIALGTSPETINSQWMNSPPHRANILDPRLNSVGVALLNRAGRIYAVADFSMAIPNLMQPQIEEKIAALLRSRSLLVNDDHRQDARQTCEMQQGSAGGSHPMFVMRWQGADLSHLPDALVQRIATGRYKTAAVGACNSANPRQAFASYRVAVLLYY